MTPFVSFLKFLAEEIANDNFHEAKQRIPEANRLLEKMTPDEHNFCTHLVGEARKIYTRNFKNFDRFLEQQGGEKLQLIPAASFFSIL